MSNWWARKLSGSEEAPPAEPSPPLPPMYQQRQQPQAVPQQQPQTPASTSEDNWNKIWDPQSYQGLMTQSAKAGDTQSCPDCGSPRFYQRASKSVTTQAGVIPPKPRCMDCGFPDRQGPG